LGIFISESHLSREISRKINSSNFDNEVLDISDLPRLQTTSFAKEWATQLRSKNPAWWEQVEILKQGIETLFFTNYEFLTSIVEGTSQIDTIKAGRRLRFAANRIGVLGFISIHKQITELLCDQPWILKYPSYLLEGLGRQGFSEDIWKIFNFHINQSREMSVYMSAVTLRALRFVPRLEVEDWHRLMDYMFTGEEITRLMATETWLMLSSPLMSAPYPEEVLKNVREILADSNPPSRRLLKNYLLILGKLDQRALKNSCSEKFAADPLLKQAYDLALSGNNTNVLLSAEPDVIRRKYYSKKYQQFDDLSEGSSE
jgi:hypothetical protein